MNYAPIIRILIPTLDFIYSLKPQPQPKADNLKKARIIAHRGLKVPPKARENTLAAFELALNNGFHGIELDIRFTKDDHPIVCHDDNLYRVFKKKVKLHRKTWKELQQIEPEICDLKTVAEQFGKRVCLFIELKNEKYIYSQTGQENLKSILSTLVPQRDYYIMSFNPAIPKLLPFIPNEAFLLIAGPKIKWASSHVLTSGLGGLMGHYFLLSNQMIEQHHRAGQVVGTGFIDSKNLFNREVNRNVDFLFTNKEMSTLR